MEPTKCGLPESIVPSSVMLKPYSTINLHYRWKLVLKKCVLLYGGLTAMELTLRLQLVCL